MIKNSEELVTNHSTIPLYIYKYISLKSFYWNRNILDMNLGFSPTGARENQ